tara:strand:- start:620 stop:1033 length:414 start_codon:yes stop_codon:yes gene_type:complete
MLSKEQGLAAELYEIKQAKKKLNQDDAERTEELIALMGKQEARMILFPDNDGVMRELRLTMSGALDATEIAKVYDLLPENQVDSVKRKLVYTEVKETRKVDAVRAKQLEKLGGEVGKIIRYAREISQSPKLSIKEIK